ncbi:glycosyltransferase family 2 protein [Pontiella agarivorans]|uniref:Glycosyltransferase family 2 protein n=1 Tax=Pontiella agarivorans TaxID=3038953 RepID=A0ABU5MT08_9BACT|nr:glycosyltransferase family 2 protein [Pontiella agarivorans]MDZ8117329.1 glycosyltransferase family 2 protein [Pontiella agarivorans]
MKFIPVLLEEAKAMIVESVKKNPLVSIIVPVHNRPSELERAIKSILNQTFSDFEIIVVDDCSTDSTPGVIQTLEDLDDRVSGYRNEKNGGGAYTRNEGARRARGELLAFLDSDDEWVPEKLERQIAYMKNCDGHAVLASYYLVVETNGRVHKRGPGIIPTGHIRESLLKGVCNAVTSVVLIKKEHFDRVGGFSGDLQSMQDYDLWIKLSEFYTCECIPEYLTIMHTDADVRISISPQYRIAGINMFLDKWAETISREIGEKYVDDIRNHHMDSVYYHVAISGLRIGEREPFWTWIRHVRSHGVRNKRNLLLAIGFYILSFLKSTKV